MGKLTIIKSQNEFDNILTNNELLVVKFTAAWCGPCKAIAPIVEKFHDEFSNIQFGEVDVDEARDVAKKYSITAMPTFVYFAKKKEVDRIRGANPEGIYKSLVELSKVSPNAIRSEGGNGNGNNGSSSGSNSTPDDIKKILNNTKFELLNDSLHFGEAEILNIKSSDPSSDLRNLLNISSEKPSLIESDADSQVLIYLPLQNKAKVQSIYIKSKPADDSSDIQPPSIIKVWANLPSIISFDDATDGGIKPLHNSPVPSPDENGWYEIPLRYVHFQNVTSLQIFLDGEDEDSSTILEKILIIGSKGENREQGKIEKIE